MSIAELPVHGVYSVLISAGIYAAILPAFAYRVSTRMWETYSEGRQMLIQFVGLIWFGVPAYFALRALSVPFNEMEPLRAFCLAVFALTVTTVLPVFAWHGFNESWSEQPIQARLWVGCGVFALYGLPIIQTLRIMAP